MQINILLDTGCPLAGIIGHEYMLLVIMKFIPVNLGAKLPAEFLKCKLCCQTALSPYPRTAK